MRKRIKRRRLKKVGIAIAAVMLPFAAGLGAKAAPVFTEMAQKLSNIKVGFENDPDRYTGEPEFNIQSLLGEEEIISEGFGWQEESDSNKAESADAEISGEKGPKPYPEKWDISEEIQYMKAHSEITAVLNIFLLTTAVRLETKRIFLMEFCLKKAVLNQILKSN